MTLYQRLEAFSLLIKIQHQLSMLEIYWSKQRRMLLYQT